MWTNVLVWCRCSECPQTTRSRAEEKSTVTERLEDGGEDGVVHTMVLVLLHLLLRLLIQPDHHLRSGVVLSLFVCLLSCCLLSCCLLSCCLLVVVLLVAVSLSFSFFRAWSLLCYVNPTSVFHKETKHFTTKHSWKLTINRPTHSHSQPHHIIPLW